MMSTEQEYLLKLLHEVDDICKKHNIKYYLAGGTVLGAIRHKGFIPWDDDMDLYMTRDEYLRFVKVCSEELPEDRFLECQELDRDYPNMFSRYTDCNTCAIHKNQILGNSRAGGIIDILQLDPIFDDPKVQKKYNRDMMLYSDLLNAFVVYSNRYEHNRFRYRWYRILMKIFGKERVLKSLEKRMLEYKDEDCTRYAMRWGGASFYFDKDWFGWGRFEQFEDLMCPIPVRSNDYLTWHYGDDWTSVPPHADRAGHDAVMSLTHSYKDVQKMYEGLLDKDKVMKAFRKRKLNYIEHIQPRHRVSEDTQKIKSVAVKNALLKRIGNHDLRQLLNDLDYATLSEIFTPFFNYQFNKDTIGREDFAGIYRFLFPIRVQISDDILFVASKYLLQTNRIAKAQRLIDLRTLESPDTPLTKEIQSVCDFIKEFRKSVSLYDAGKKQESLDLCNELLKINPNVMSLFKLKLRILFDFGEEHYSEAKTILDKALAIDPYDGEYHKFMGDLILHKGNLLEAFNIYCYAYTHSLNGFMQLEIRELFTKHEEALYNQIESLLASKDYEQVLRVASPLRKISVNNERLAMYVYTALIEMTILNQDETKLWKMVKTIKKYVSVHGWSDKPKELFTRLFTTLGETKENIEYRIELESASYNKDYTSIIDKLSKIDTVTAKKLMADALYKSGDHLKAFKVYNSIILSEMTPIVKLELNKFYTFHMNRLAKLLISNEESKRRIPYLMKEWKLKFNTWDNYNQIVERLEIPVKNLMLSKSEIRDKLMVIRETIKTAQQTLKDTREAQKLNDETNTNSRAVFYETFFSDNDESLDNNMESDLEELQSLDDIQDLENDDIDASNNDNDNLETLSSGDDDDDDLENITIELINCSKEERFNLYYTYIYDCVAESEAND